MIGANNDCHAGFSHNANLLVVDTAVHLALEPSADSLYEYSGHCEGVQVSRAYLRSKRIMDIVGALLGLFFVLLLFPFIIAFIWWEDRGPIFFRHVRIGQFNHPFFTYKFRSMRIDADDYLHSHPEIHEAWKKTGKLADDPRVTRVGRFLRRSSLDELPQLINVLRGEMSLVGPRAIQSSEMERFSEVLELRQMVKPGLTGLWQISGRSMTDYEQRAALDCIYVMNRSFFIDLLIVLKTIPAVLSGVGAC